jgi:hypothetical protein
MDRSIGTNLTPSKNATANWLSRENKIRKLG